MAHKKTAQADALRSLRAQWALFFLFGALAIIAGYLTFVSQPRLAPAWLAFTSLVFVFQMSIQWFDLPLNKTSARSVLQPRFGAAMWLSLARLLLLALLAGFLLPPRPAGALAWAPFVLYLLFNLLDLADGYVARTTGSPTQLGAKLDMDLDGLGVLVAAMLAVRYGMVGWWYLLVGFARYIYVFGLWLRNKLGLPFASTENHLRRPFAGVQMGVGTTHLAPALSPLIGTFIGSFTMVPFLANFLYDWLRGTGRLQTPKPIGRKWSAMFSALLFLVRVGAAIPFIQLGSFGFVYYLAAVAFLLGLLTRPIALVALIFFCSQLQTPATAWFVLIGLLLILLYAGPGDYAFARHKDVWFFRRAGE